MRAAILAALLPLTACGGGSDQPEAPAAAANSTLQVNQQDEARRNLEEAVKPYSIGETGDQAMGMPTPATPEPLDDKVVANVMENAQ